MGGGKTHEVLVTLTRNSANEPWGFSLVGGVDVKTPLIVTRVSFGSRADGVLQRGDIITKIGNYDSRDIRHQDAQTLFNNSGNSVRVVVQREPSKIRKGGSAGSSLTSPLSVSPHLSPRGGGAVSSPGYSPGAPALTPYYSTPFTPLDDYHFSAQDNFGNFGGGRGSEDPNLHVTNQVANTVLNRIQVADPNIQVVHKQFNSPINMYSDANIADTLAKQGVKVRKPVKYNPAESETYRAVQEEQLGDNVQEVLIPPQPKVFTPHKPAQVKIADPQYQLPKKMPENPETIHQSNSFKRLMWSVMAESSY
ncbi:PDZ and LIM domain protein 3 isoform X4 [Onthophagus taurus]|uniref:PDZ and LIM domain protein 3 isoform X4 n=1 Tax=Onthophagus taurus TaxID=166361 RepID=UPI0039BDCBE0